MTDAVGVFYLVVLVFGVLLGVAWLLVPFILFGIRSEVRAMARAADGRDDELRRIRQLLDAAEKRARDGAKREQIRAKASG